jgi:alpha-tubulin suppressor-like RCC1 family protein
MRKLISLLVPALLVSSFFSSTPVEAATSPQRIVFEDTLSAGGSHSCAVTVAGLVRCWGANWADQTDVPSDLGVVSQVSAGGNHSCAVTVAGLVRCWG